MVGKRARDSDDEYDPREEKKSSVATGNVRRSKRSRPGKKFVSDESADSYESSDPEFADKNESESSDEGYVQRRRQGPRRPGLRSRQQRRFVENEEESDQEEVALPAAEGAETEQPAEVETEEPTKAQAEESAKAEAEEPTEPANKEKEGEDRPTESDLPKDTVESPIRE